MAQFAFKEQRFTLSVDMAKGATVSEAGNYCAADASGMSRKHFVGTYKGRDWYVNFLLYSPADSKKRETVSL